MGDLPKVIGGAVMGVVLGWVGTALTNTGRLDAIEHTLTRIEKRIDDVQTAQSTNTGRILKEIK